jgi:signal transduction histidine kinase
MLTAMNIDLAVIERQLLKAGTPTMVTTVVEKVRYLSGMVESTIQRMRRLALELRPDILDNLGLDEALEWQVKEFQARTSIRCELSKPPKAIAIDEPRAIALFRMFQESLTNIVRHAHASKVEIRLKEQSGTVILEIRDNGKGIKETDLQGIRSLGIIGMRERAANFGGQVRIAGVPDQGTTVTIEVPLA